MASSTPNDPAPWASIVEPTTLVGARQLAFAGAMPVPFALGGTTAQVVDAMLPAASRRR
jgi:hypothetical protein